MRPREIVVGTRAIDRASPGRNLALQSELSAAQTLRPQDVERGRVVGSAITAQSDISSLKKAAEDALFARLQQERVQGLQTSMGVLEREVPRNLAHVAEIKTLADMLEKIPIHDQKQFQHLKSAIEILEISIAGAQEEIQKLTNIVDILKNDGKYNIEDILNAKNYSKNLEKEARWIHNYKDKIQVLANDLLKDQAQGQNNTQQIKENVDVIECSQSHIRELKEHIYFLERTLLHQQLADRLLPADQAKTVNTESAAIPHQSSEEHRYSHRNFFPAPKDAMFLPAEQPLERFIHPQGDNAQNWEHTCMVVTCEQLINNFASRDVIRQLLGADHASERLLTRYLLEKGAGLSQREGRLSVSETMDLLHDFQLAPKFQASADLQANGRHYRSIMCQGEKWGSGFTAFDDPYSVETLAREIKAGKGVLLLVNNKNMYDEDIDVKEKTRSTHAVIAARAVYSQGDLSGLRVNDSGISLTGVNQFLTRADTLDIEEFVGRKQFLPISRLEAIWQSVCASEITFTQADGTSAAIPLYGGHIVVE